MGEKPKKYEEGLKAKASVRRQIILFFSILYKNFPLFHTQGQIFLFEIIQMNNVTADEAPDVEFPKNDFSFSLICMHKKRSQPNQNEIGLTRGNEWLKLAKECTQNSYD